MAFVVEPRSLEYHFFQSFLFNGVGVGAPFGQQSANDFFLTVVVVIHQIVTDKVSASAIGESLARTLVHVYDVAVGIGYSDSAIHPECPVGNVFSFHAAKLHKKSLTLYR